MAAVTKNRKYRNANISITNEQIWFKFCMHIQNDCSYLMCDFQGREFFNMATIDYVKLSLCCLVMPPLNDISSETTMQIPTKLSQKHPCLSATKNQVFYFRILTKMAAVTKNRKI